MGSRGQCLGFISLEAIWGTMVLVPRPFQRGRGGFRSSHTPVKVVFRRKLRFLSVKGGDFH